jgi:prophage regulatory protein
MTDRNRPEPMTYPPLQPGEDRLIPLARSMEIVGLGKSMIYRLMRQGRFPQACKPGGAATRWSEREVCAWKDEQLAARAS